MRYIVLFEDDPDKADVRPRLMPDHRAFLKRNDAILETGPLVDESGVTVARMWSVEAADREAVTALVHEDPFWLAGVRKSVRVLLWNRGSTAGRSQPA